MVWSVVQPTLTPLDVGSRSSLAALNDVAGDAGFSGSGLRSFFTVTLTHSPLATCSTRGSGLIVPAFALLTSLLRTKAARTRFDEGRSPALMVKVWVGVLVGQGWPGLVVGGGLLPLVVGRVVSVVGVGLSGRGWRSGVWPARTRTMPQAPWFWRKLMPLP